MTGLVELAPKRVGETKTYTFDFLSVLPVGVTISSVTSITAAVYSGVDANPSAIISGGSSINGSIISQKFTAGVLGTLYYIVVKVATSDGQTLELAGFLAVIPDVI